MIHETNLSAEEKNRVAERSRELLHDAQQEVYRRTDRLFAMMLSAQWLVGIFLAFVVSPRSWAGGSSAPHIHLYAAVILGGLVALVPAALALRRPGEVLTRHVVAVAQALMAALFIHLTGGRIETHFFIFVMMGILTTYSDWRILVSYSAITAIDHLVRAILWPQSLFGVITASEWRVVEHAAYVVFEAIFLIRLSLLTVHDKRRVAEQQAQLELNNEKMEAAFEQLNREKARAEEQQAEAEHAAGELDRQRAELAERVDTILEAMNRFADGDLTVQVDAAGSSGSIAALFDGFNRVVADFRRIMQRVGEVVVSTTRAASDISATSEQLAASAQEQSMQADEVAVAIEEMTRTIMDNTQSTQQTAEAADEGGRRAADGGRVVEQTVEKMREIAEVVAESAGTVERLGASSERIGEITQVIDEIADQTNLLALNAAIEAARAGEQGKGFAVVADEVRKLAERTAQATDEIADTIEQVQQETQAAVQSMQRGTARVEEGRALADQTGRALEQIVTATDRIGEMIAHVATASEEQSATSEQISQSVQSISSVSHEAAAAVTQVSGAASGLERQTTELRALVASFRLEDNRQPAAALV